MLNIATCNDRGIISTELTAGKKQTLFRFEYQRYQKWKRKSEALHGLGIMICFTVECRKRSEQVNESNYTLIKSATTKLKITYTKAKG